MVNPRDEVAFRRIVNKPARGVGASSVEKIMTEARIAGAGGGLLEAAKKIKLPPKAAAGIDAFASVLEKGRALLDGEADSPRTANETAVTPRKKAKKGEIRAGEGLSVCVASLVIESGLAEHHTSHDEINGYQRAGNLQELVNASSLYPATTDGLLQFLEHIELDRSIEEDTKPENQDTVTLITLHNTKGLEFRRVVLTGLEQGVFPRDDKEGEDLEEERRLFYVGATRAMDELYLTSCAERRMYGRTEIMMPSVFLREADRQTLRIIGKAPAGFGGGAAGAGRPGKTSSDGRWKTGDRLYCDEQGYGYVTGIDESGEDGPVIKARFDNGRETRFLSLYQSAKYTKMGNDDW